MELNSAVGKTGALVLREIASQAQHHPVSPEAGGEGSIDAVLQNADEMAMGL